MPSSNNVHISQKRVAYACCYLKKDAVNPHKAHRLYAIFNSGCSVTLHGQAAVEAARALKLDWNVYY